MDFDLAEERIRQGAKARPRFRREEDHSQAAPILAARCAAKKFS
jgi:hypothetical protein